ncbi:hypothetical protein L1887_21205 [Cichorium endivia]|nr:hypothetical protein L1887_21205 [Cichorium endivia]
MDLDWMLDSLVTGVFLVKHLDTQRSNTQPLGISSLHQRESMAVELHVGNRQVPRHYNEAFRGSFSHKIWTSG